MKGNNKHSLTFETMDLILTLVTIRGDAKGAEPAQTSFMFQ